MSKCDGLTKQISGLNNEKDDLLGNVSALQAQVGNMDFITVGGLGMHAHQLFVTIVVSTARGSGDRQGPIT